MVCIIKLIIYLMLIVKSCGNELNADFYVEETDIMVTPSPKPKKSKTSEYMCILYVS